MDIPEDDPPPPTREQLAAWLSGDAEAARGLFARHRDELLARAQTHRLMRPLRRHVTPEDVVDEVFLRALSSGLLTRFEDRGKGSLMGALYTVLDRVLADAALERAEVPAQASSTSRSTRPCCAATRARPPRPTPRPPATPAPRTCSTCAARRCPRASGRSGACGRWRTWTSPPSPRAWSSRSRPSAGCTSAPRSASSPCSAARRRAARDGDHPAAEPRRGR